MTNSDPPEVWTEAVIAMTTSENEEVIGSAIESLIALMDQPEGEEGQEVLREHTSTTTKIAITDQHEGEDGKAVLCEHTSTMTKFYIGDICWVISHEEYMYFVIPVIERGRLNWGEITRGGETVEFLTTDADGAGWPQDSGILGVLRFDDLEPEYQERAERLEKGGYVVIFESKARDVGELTHVELMAKNFFEPEDTDEED